MRSSCRERSATTSKRQSSARQSGLRASQCQPGEKDTRVVGDARARLPFHLPEDEPASAADDQVELVAAGPHVGAEDAIAAEAVVARGAGLVRVAMRTQAR